MSQINRIKEKAKADKKRVLLPEAEIDLRVIKAAVIMAEENVAEPVLLGDKEKIRKLAAEEGVKIPDTIRIEPVSNKDAFLEKFEFFKKKLAHKNPTEEKLKAMSNDSLFTAGWMLEKGMGDAAVAGSVASTSNVIISALRTVGVSEHSELVSSTFLMELPDGRVFSYADCAVVPYPNSEQLASIAIDTGKTHRLLTGNEQKIAFLSFSTRGSAKHERVDLVQNAVKIARDKKPNWIIDGDLQFDAAVVPDIAKRKAPDSQLSGKANVFIFPNLDAGNIAYKITERLAGAVATGPILQGLKKPYMDLSRGCSVDDIVNVACVGSLLSSEF